MSEVPWVKESLQVVHRSGLRDQHVHQRVVPSCLQEQFAGVATRAHIRLRKQCWHRSTTQTALTQLTRRAKSSTMNESPLGMFFLMTADDTVVRGAAPPTEATNPLVLRLTGTQYTSSCLAGTKFA